MIPNFDDAKIRILSRIPIHYEKNYKYLDGIKIENKLPTSINNFSPRSAGNVPDQHPSPLIKFIVNPITNLISKLAYPHPLLLPIIAYYCLSQSSSAITSQLISAYHRPSHPSPSPPPSLQTKKGEPRRLVSGALPCVKGGGHLLSRIALQYHRRRRA